MAAEKPYASTPSMLPPGSGRASGTAPCGQRWGRQAGRGEEPGREGGGGRRAVRPARCRVARPSDRRKSSQADTSVIKTLFYMRPQ